MVGLILANNPIPVPVVAAPSGGSFGWMLLWMMLVLVLVVGGMLMLSHFLKRFPGLTRRRGENLALEESLALNAKASVHIIEVEGERQLIGTSEGAIVHLAHLSPKASQKTSPKAFQEALEE
ncbi:MAG: flagellar biosynthetic protein FliO [Myxococcota bacterium]|nr:flagellar biosynthetic protein FliO [Myxococcota bacterium]